MNEGLKIVIKNLPDGTKNGETIQALQDMRDKTATAAAITPKSKAYNSQVELIATLTAKKDAPCGADCKVFMDRITGMKSLGHDSFKDK